MMNFIIEYERVKNNTSESDKVSGTFHVQTFSTDGSKCHLVVDKLETFDV